MQDMNVSTSSHHHSKVDDHSQCDASSRYSCSTANATPERVGETDPSGSGRSRLRLKLLPKSLRVPTSSFFQKGSDRLRSTSVASSSDGDASDSEDEHQPAKGTLCLNNQRPQLKKLVSQTVKVEADRLALTEEPLIAHPRHMPCLAEDLCCDSDDSDCDHQHHCPPPIGAWYMPQPASFNPSPLVQAQDVDETITESMFSCNDELQSTNFVQYSINEDTDLKKKRIVKAVRK